MLDGQTRIEFLDYDRINYQIVWMKALIILTLALNLVTDHPAASQVAKRVTTPEQRFFDWTTLQFSKEVYQKRRSDLVESLRSSGGGVYMTPSQQDRSHGFSFRQL
ncbi:MAG: hypothetical protein ACE5G1_17345, partial [bacterium]